MRLFRGFVSLVSISFVAVSCTTYRTAKEITLVGFTENVTKGQSVGEIEGDDCVHTILGYKLGGYPNLGRAIKNARHQKKSTVGDAFGGSSKAGDEGVRYVNNLHVERDGFNAVVYAKDCVVAKGAGFK